MGATWSSAPAVRSAPCNALEQIANTASLWSRASRRALARPMPASGELPKVVQKELLMHLKQRQRTEQKLGDARETLQQVEWEARSNEPLQTVAARGALFDDDDYADYALMAAQCTVQHYENKRELLLDAHVQRMVQLNRAGG